MNHTVPLNWNNIRASRSGCKFASAPTSLKVYIGLSCLGALAVTVAVKAATWPNVVGVSVEDSVVVVLAALTVSVKSWLKLGAVPLLAVMVKLKMPAAAGVPLSTPALLRVTPAFLSEKCDFLRPHASGAVQFGNFF